jgi:hypothetical protein
VHQKRTDKPNQLTPVSIDSVNVNVNERTERSTMPLFSYFWKKSDDDESSGDECEDNSAEDLSYVGTAVYEVLRRHHNHRHHELWNVTKAKIVGDIQYTPTDAFTRERTDPEEGHSDWFPKKVLSVMRRTQHWCDVMSLAPPDGVFLAEFKDALREICDNQTMNTSLMSGHNRVTVRMMFGNVVGMPVNCNKLITDQGFTSRCPQETQIVGRILAQGCQLESRQTYCRRWQVPVDWGSQFLGCPLSAIQTCQ